MQIKEAHQSAELIWGELFSIKNENLTKDEQIRMIRKVILNVGEENYIKGKRHTINKLKDSIEGLN